MTRYQYDTWHGKTTAPFLAHPVQSAPAKRVKLRSNLNAPRSFESYELKSRRATIATFAGVASFCVVFTS